MGLLDKVKNLFTDEEIIEDDRVSIREIKKEKEEKEESKLPTFMREKIEEEEGLKEVPQADFKLVNENVDDYFDSNKTDDKINDDITIKDNKTDEINKFKFPIEFEENDFVETRSRRNDKFKQKNEESTKKIEINNNMKEEKEIDSPKPDMKVSELYKDKIEPKKHESKKFKSTPIISPVYGVLDKNYQPDDLTQNSPDDYDVQRPSKSIDFDSVRKKAYGKLEDDIKDNLLCENCEYLKEVKECRKEKKECDNNSEKNLMYDILNEEKEEEETFGSVSSDYYDYGKEYEHKSTADNYKEELEKEEVTINNSSDEIKEEKVIKEVPPVKSKINLLSTLKKSTSEDNGDKSELTDDIFNLIDSMYEERDD